MHPNQWLTEPEMTDRPLVDTAYEVYSVDAKKVFPLTEEGLTNAKTLAKSLSKKDVFIGISIESSNFQGRTGSRGILVYHNGSRYH